jgi:hypothetical protein
MKKYLLIIAMFLGTLSSWGQTVADQAAVIQRCIDLPGLQQYYPMAPDQTSEQVYVVQQPVLFATGLAVSKFNKPVVFVANSTDVTNYPVAYFVFEVLTFNGQTANVVFNFYYPNPANKSKIKGTVALSKVGENWVVAENKLNRE